MYICRYVYAVYVDILVAYINVSCICGKVFCFCKSRGEICHRQCTSAVGGLGPDGCGLVEDMCWGRNSRLFPVLGCPVGRWDQWLGSMGWLFHLLVNGVFIEVITH